MTNIALFASGSGTNAENIINYFENHTCIKAGLVLTNNPEAGVIERAKRRHVPVQVFNRQDFREASTITEKLSEYHIRFIVLAGFLWLIPDYLIQAFPQRIVNIHPALLPAYGGKGMYGMHVHRAVVDNKEQQSGITIHEVNNEYDRGRILFQATCAVTPNDTPESVAAKVHLLEYAHFPKVIEQWIVQQL
jgi:phosphoribosylglycinamide formyltransferase-1